VIAERWKNPFESAATLERSSGSRHETRSRRQRGQFRNSPSSTSVERNGNILDLRGRVRLHIHVVWARPPGARSSG